MSIRVAVIGAGYFANFHIRAWLRLKDVELVAIVDPDTTKHDALHALVNAEKSPDTLIVDTLQHDSVRILKTELDIIDIATPPHTHAEVILESVKLNCKLIVCQKPFCGDLRTAEEIFDQTRDCDSKIVVHENFRFQPWYKAIKYLLESAMLGEILQADFKLRTGDGQGEDAYLSRQPYFRDMKRFLIHETGIHFIDVFRYLFGEPQALSSELRKLNPVIAGEDAGHFIFYYDEGVRAVFDGNRLLDHVADNPRLTMGEMTIEGTKGSLTLTGNGELTLRESGSQVSKRVDFDFNDIDFGGDCVYLLQLHLVDHLTTGSPLSNELTDYLYNLRLEELVYQAAQEHRRIVNPALKSKARP